MFKIIEVQDKVSFIQMHSTRLFSKYLILLSCFTSCLLRQASARACYVCESNINDEMCFTNVNDGFQFDCAKFITEISNNIDESSEYLQALLNRYSTEYVRENFTNFDCVTVIGQTLNETKILRSCIPRTEECDTLMSSMTSLGFLLDSCNRCDADLCNSQFSHVQQEISTQAINHKQMAKSHAKEMKPDYLRVGLLCTTVFILVRCF